MEEKMTLREHFQIALRAVRWTFSIDRRYTLCLFACALFSAVAPFAAVYFSARVIDALAAGLIAQAALYAALAVGVGGWWFGSGDYGAIPVFWWPM